MDGFELHMYKCGFDENRQFFVLAMQELFERAHRFVRRGLSPLEGNAAFFCIFVRLRFLFALGLCSLYTPAYARRLQIPPVPQPSPGSVSREPAPRGLRALQRRPSGTARCLESLPQEHPLLRPGQAVEAEGLLGLANFSRCQMCSAGQATE